jgi:aminoglycoside 3-N-acetyltransferase
VTRDAGQIEIGQAEIARGLRDLGLGAGMGVMVHSSLSSFGRVTGGAPAVIAALMEVITPSGTLLMPSFNHGAPFEPGGPGVYDPASTPTTNGAIPDQFWRMPGVLRSLDPTHPFAAWGQNAARYLAGHHRTLTLGPDSPLGRLHADGGWGLLLGVDYTRNTFHHVAEMALRAPCLGQRSEAYPVRLAGGRVVAGRTWGWRAARCPITDPGRYGELMRLRGFERVAAIGGCRATLFRLQDCFDVVAAALREGLGDAPPCIRCPIRPRAVEQTVPSDWDVEAQAPPPDSAAWTY